MTVFIRRSISILVSMFFFALTVTRGVLEAIGYATIPDDIRVAQGILHQSFLWVLTIPSWLTIVITFAAFMWLSWVSWPRNAAVAAAAQATSVQVATVPTNPMSALAASMRFTLGKLRSFKRELHGAKSGFDLDELSDVAAKFRATEVSLEKMGFRTPWLDVNVDPIGYIERNIEYISKVEPLISNRHEREAKRQAALIVDAFHPDFIDPQRL